MIKKNSCSYTCTPKKNNKIEPLCTCTCVANKVGNFQCFFHCLYRNPYGELFSEGLGKGRKVETGAIWTKNMRDVEPRQRYFST